MKQTLRQSELPDVQAGFKKGRCQHLLDHSKSKRVPGKEKKNKGIPEKNNFASLTMLKPLTVWITRNFGKR